MEVTTNTNMVLEPDTSTQSNIVTLVAPPFYYIVGYVAALFRGCLAARASVIRCTTMGETLASLERLLWLMAG